MVPSEEPPPIDMAAVIERSLEYDRHRYEQTENPMWAWSAIGSALDHELPLPEWLKNYLLESYALLMRAAGDDSATYPKRVLAALGFRRRPGNDDLREYHQEMVELKRGLRMWKYVQSLGKSAKATSEKLEAAEGVDSSRLRKAWKKFEERLSEMEEWEKQGAN